MVLVGSLIHMYQAIPIAMFIETFEDIILTFCRIQNTLKPLATNTYYEHFSFQLKHYRK